MDARLIMDGKPPAALIPILNGTRVTIREAITDYSANDSSRMSLVGKLLSVFKNLSQLFNLSIRNTFRRPGRLTLNFAIYGKRARFSPFGSGGR